MPDSHFHAEIWHGLFLDGSCAYRSNPCEFIHVPPTDGSRTHCFFVIILWLLQAPEPLGWGCGTYVPYRDEKFCRLPFSTS